MNPSDSNAENAEPAAGSGEEQLSRALENTLANLNTSIARMEEIVARFESGDSDLDESIRMLSEANELAVASSKELDQAVQKVVYQSGEESGGDEDTDEPGAEEATQGS